jgi:Cu/Ag efflux pump CusA
VGDILEKEQLSIVRMVYPRNQQMAVQDIQNLQIFLPSGRFLPISQLATVKTNPGDAEIKRENLQSIGEVTARLEGRDLGTVMNEIRNKIGTEIVLPRDTMLFMVVLSLSSKNPLANCLRY